MNLGLIKIVREGTILRPFRFADKNNHLSTQKKEIDRKLSLAPV